MPNGLSNDDSGTRSRDKSKQPEPVLVDDAVDSKTCESDADASHEELNDAPLKLTPDMVTPEELEVQAEMANVVVRADHPLRLIEAHWEAKRLDALLREVYEEE
jgi:hypothetical protein